MFIDVEHAFPERGVTDLAGIMEIIDFGRKLGLGLELAFPNSQPSGQ